MFVESFVVRVDVFDVCASRAANHLLIIGLPLCASCVCGWSSSVTFCSL